MRILTSVLFLVLLPAALAVPASAEIGPDDYFLSAHVGAAGFEARRTGNFVEGAGAMLRWEHMVLGDRGAFGIQVGYVGGRDSYTTSGDERARDDYSTIPVYLTGRGFLGRTSGRVFASIGAGMGFHISSVKRFVENQPSEEISTTDFAANLPVGLFVVLGDDFTVDLSYTPTFTASSEYGSNVVHTLSLGLGVRYGFQK